MSKSDKEIAAEILIAAMQSSVSDQKPIHRLKESDAKEIAKLIGLLYQDILAAVASEKEPD